MGGGSTEKPKTCGLTELLIFIAAIISGTACSVCSKTMMELRGIGIDGTEEVFAKPMFQTFGMFVGMLLGLVMHWIVLFFKIDFPGYDHRPKQAAMTTVLPTKAAAAASYGATESNNEKDKLLQETPDQTAGPVGTPVWMYFFLAIPSIFDLGATALCMMGLRFLDVSVYQLLRGSGIIFVALMKQHVLGDNLYKFQWLGVFWNVTSVILVGGTAILNSTENPTLAPGEALLGVTLVMCGAFVQALQFVFEEKVMSMDDASAPPLLLIGMEGLWGTFLCLTVVYPLAYYLPGDDHGSYEDPFNTYAMFMNSPNIQWAFFIYFFAIFSYNLFAVLVTFLLNSVWHAILDNFRPITVWGTDMFIFYVVTSTGDFGEPWTKWSWVQLFGMFVLLYGTAVYNAPNAGSIKVQGEWFHFGFDMRSEYAEIELDMQEAELDQEWQDRKQTFEKKRFSSFAERSPHISIHTQALHGLGGSHI
jgi:drug/metabolite transporter (DMT)-like permease